MMEKGSQQENSIASVACEHEGRTRRRPERRKAAEFDQRILEAARKLFAERGVEAVSMHQIAQAAGIGQGTLYRRYAHKGELIIDLLSESAQRSWQDLQAYAQDADAGPALQRLDGILQGLISFVEEQGPFLGAINDASSCTHRDMKFCIPFYITMHETITSLLNEAIAQNELPQLDAPYTADALLAALDSDLYLFQRHKRGYTPERIFRGVQRIYIEGVGTPRPGERI